MDIEQRLEALSHSVELLAGMQIETEKRMTRLAETVERLAVRTGQLQEQMATTVARTDRLQEHMATMADGLTQLARIATDHAERISDLEGNQQQ